MTAPTLVVENGVLVTLDGGRVQTGWLGIAGDRIVALAEGPAPATPGARRIDARGGYVRPGFVSAHQHSMDALLPGSAARARAFPDWLFGVYYAEVLAHTPERAAAAARRTAAGLLRAGVTTVVDCWGVGDAGSARSRECLAATVEVARASGLRWVLAPMTADRLPHAWAADLARVAAADPRFRPDGLTTSTDTALEFTAHALDAAGHGVTVWPCAELPEMASDELLRGLAALAARSDGWVTTHLSASPEGARGAVDRILAALPSGRVLGAHLTHAEPAELARLARAGAGAAHCPSSTMLGGGAPSALGRIREAGLPVGLGLDNGSVNGTADMVLEMRHALMFDRVAGTTDRRACAETALDMATREGAVAIGRPDLGVLRVGATADLVVVDTSGEHWWPRADPAAAMVFQERPGDVTDVVVGGRVLVSAREPVPAQ
ncbi:amidohydrolase family protein [Pseudonocardia sp. WMMC193]|uniref:amidohydrolase family protein n=1 Tax=Pseudonocardia sp. WMMC193 TaxID=2911965 RepID=UPI001F342B3C|nr:amidohydrolase family protein [Pseudonocardia sp. WMMC193]MCF7548218.1 amidohydrolase family protein [Pseudonocardia sp. WMMC193]